MVTFESTLERDLITLLEFNPAVESYQSQPVRIDYVFQSTERHHYTPDYLIRYSAASNALPTLCEVKYRVDLQKNWNDWKRSFKEAHRYAANRDLRFKIFTEVEIRTPYLYNAQFLLPFRRCRPNPESAELLINMLHDLKQTSPEILVRSIYSDDARAARLLSTLWKLVGEGCISTDLSQKLSKHSRIW